MVVWWGVGAGERDVVGGVVIFCGEAEGEGKGEEGVDDGDDVVAVGDGEGAGLVG